MTSVTALSGSASADDMDAPYARAAAKVARDATVLASKNVASVTRGTGTSAEARFFSGVGRAHRRPGTLVPVGRASVRRAVKDQ
ncbi:hypothetical protein ACWC5C_05985 [Streptomyces sp. NPDC001700]